MFIQDIFIYPIKALSGIRMEESSIQEDGLELDRRWFLRNLEGKVITQRDVPELALFKQEMVEDFIKVSFSNSFIPVPLYAQEGEPIMSYHFGDEIVGYEVSNAISRWFSEQLKMDVNLMAQSKKVKRPVDEKYAKDAFVNASDGYPVLVVGTATLDYLNQFLDSKVGMDRFRPNVVVKTTIPFEEEKWTNFYVNDLLWQGVKDCGRCQVININPETGEVSKEVLIALAKINTKGNKVVFGRNCIPAGFGHIKIGMYVQLA